MAVFTAAVAAISSLATLGLSATAIAVGTAVSVAGLGLSVVGGITGNKTLSNIGKWFGVAGAVSGLGGVLAGGTQALNSYSNLLTKEWNTGLGQFFASGDSVLKGPNLATPAATMDTVSSQFAGITGENSPLSTSYLDQIRSGQTMAGNPITPASVSASKALGGSPVLEAAKATSNLQPPNITGAPTIPPPSGSLPPSGVIDATIPPAESFINQGLQGGVSSPAQAFHGLTGKTLDTSKDNWWTNLSVSDKIALGSVAAQAGAGALEGMFASMSADERLEFDKMRNQQLQANTGWVQPRPQFTSPGGPVGLLRKA